MKIRRCYQIFGAGVIDKCVIDKCVFEIKVGFFERVVYNFNCGSIFLVFLILYIEEIKNIKDLDNFRDIYL